MVIDTTTNEIINSISVEQNISVPALGTFLKEKDALTIQVKRFLATAVWLRLKGKEKLTTTDVTKALRENHQSRLGNPSDTLNQNIRQGFCERDGKVFFVTPQGFQEIGIDELGAV